MIGQEIYRLRKKANLTQEELAAKMGITMSAVSKWENGRSVPDLPMLCALADFFGVTTDELLGRGRKERYLVCDDACIIRNAVSNLLEKRGYPCKAVENGSQLYEEMRREMPFGVFLDVHLGGGEDGLEILKTIKKEYPAVKVVIITGDSSEETKQRAMEYGADHLIHKPFHEGLIYDAILALSGPLWKK